MVEKFNDKDAKKGNFNKQMKFRKRSIIDSVPNSYFEEAQDDIIFKMQRSGVLKQFLNLGASQWIRGVHQFFELEENHYNENKWQKILEPLTADIAKLLIYNIPIHMESFNLAVEKKEEGYVLRYFGFDFTHKSTALKIPSGEKMQELIINEEMIKNYINNALFTIFENEFTSIDEKTLQLQESLVGWGLQKVIDKLKG